MVLSPNAAACRNALSTDRAEVLKNAEFPVSTVWPPGAPATRAAARRSAVRVSSQPRTTDQRTCPPAGAMSSGSSTHTGLPLAWRALAVAS